jgi:hypothetical protein
VHLGGADLCFPRRRPAPRRGGRGWKCGRTEGGEGWKGGSEEAGRLHPNSGQVLVFRGHLRIEHDIKGREG